MPKRLLRFGRLAARTVEGPLRPTPNANAGARQITGFRDYPEILGLLAGALAQLLRRDEAWAAGALAYDGSRWGCAGSLGDGAPAVTGRELSASVSRRSTVSSLGGSYSANICYAS